MKRAHNLEETNDTECDDDARVNSGTTRRPASVTEERTHQVILSNDLDELKVIHGQGYDLTKPLDDVGTNPLLLAAHLGFVDITTFIVQSQQDLLEDDVLDVCKALVSKFESSGNMAEMDHLNRLVSAWNVDRPTLPCVVIVQHAFKILRDTPIYLATLCEAALHMDPSLSRDISLNLVLYEDTHCYWRMLCNGVDLNDLWPINCEENPYSKYYTKHNLFDIYFNYGCLFTIHASGRNQITKMTIQAANGSSSPSVLYVIQNFPTDLHDDVFRFLILAGFKMSSTDIQRMANVEIDKASELVAWYKRFHSQPHRLKHLSRLAIRHSLRHNVPYSLDHLLLPGDLYDYLLLNGVSDKEGIV